MELILGVTNLLAIAFPIRQSQWNRMQFNTWCRLLNFHFHFHFISWICRDLFCSHNSIPSIRIESLLLNMRRSIRVVLIVVQWLTDWWGWKHQSDLGCDAPPSQSRRQVTRIGAFHRCARSSSITEQQQQISISILMAGGLLRVLYHPVILVALGWLVWSELFCSVLLPNNVEGASPTPQPLHQPYHPLPEWRTDGVWWCTTTSYPVLRNSSRLRGMERCNEDVS